MRGVMEPSVFYARTASGVDANLRDVPFESFTVLLAVPRCVDGEAETEDYAESQYDDSEIAPHDRSPSFEPFQQ
jgi:hypothetical protein